MRMLLVILGLCVTGIVCADDSSPSLATRKQQAARYTAAMRAALGDLKVTLREVKLQPPSVHVRYESANEEQSPAFVLAAVLALAAPLASGEEARVCVSSYAGDHRLVQVTLAPADLMAACAWQLSQPEQERLGQLAASVLAAAASAPEVR